MRHLANTSLADLARASAKAKGEMPGRTKEAEKKASEVGTEIGQKIDSAVRPYPPLFPRVPSSVFPNSSILSGLCGTR